ncbi:M20 family metallopeptidase [Caryophanon tenue]|uniref:Carboxypeptidase n=1 Tax=Caryophanon tenue TaxID=33978 RepID=A0A1C0Y5Q5_9BACL|nr:M20 family metallopeptidase [Caryophanon tenue]OCS82476.1 carboxypeptidase [Caryophanon tenue]
MLKEAIYAKEQEMLQLLERMVNQDSGSKYKKGVDAIGHMLRQKYEKLGFIVDVVNEVEVGNHLIIRHKETVRPRIVIVGHMDTVFPVGTAQDRPFTIKGSRAYGPGVIDMKASQVALFTALSTLVELGDKESYTNVHIILNSDEEIGSHRSKIVIENVALGKDYALILEPARDNGALVSARRGGGTYILRVYGKAAHSGIAPQDGISAIEEISYKIIELQKLNSQQEGMNVNVGLIRGGEAANVVSPYAEASIDVRITRPEQGAEIDKAIRKICSKPHIKGTNIELVGGINRYPVVKNEKTLDLLTHIQEVGAEIGVPIQDVATGGGSDASFTSSVHVATIDGLGPVGGGAHSVDEYLELPTFTERTYLLAKVIQRLSQVRLHPDLEYTI